MPIESLYYIIKTEINTCLPGGFIVREIVYGPLQRKQKSRPFASEEYIGKIAEDYLKRGGETSFCYISPTYQMLNLFRDDLLDRLQLKGTGELRFFLFEGLFNEILKAEGAYRPELKGCEQEFILKRVIDELAAADKLEFFAGMTGFDGFYRGLANLINQLEEAAIYPEEWLQAVETSKEKEIYLIYRKYLTILEDNGLMDSGLKYRLLFEVLGKNSSFLKEIDLFIIDGFQKFTGVQYRFIERLTTLNKGIIINTHYDDERQELYATMAKAFQGLDGFTYRTFERYQAEERPTVLNYLVDNLFKIETEQQLADDSLTLLEAPDRETEIDLVVRECKKLIIDGSRPDRIAVIIRQPDIYAGLIERKFTEYGLPFTRIKGIPFFSTPIWKVISLLFRVLDSNLERVKVISLLKSNYLNHLEQSEYDKAEETINSKQILQGKDWFRLSDEVDSGARIFSSIKNLIQLKSQFSGKKDFKEFAIALMSYLYSSGIEENIFNQQNIDLVGRDLWALKCLDQALEELGLLINTEIEYQEFKYWLKRYLEKVEIKMGQEDICLVEVLTPSQARGKGYDHVFLVGLLEGEFPLVVENNWLFSKEEKKGLADRGINLEEDNYKLIQERFFFISSIALAEKRAYLSYPSLGASSGGQLISSFVQEIKYLFIEDSLYVKRVTSMGSCPESMDEILNLADARDFFLANCSNNSLYQLLPAYQAERERWSKNYSSWDGLLEKNDILDCLKNHYNPGYVYSSSELETYANCPFKYFAGRVIKLKDIEEPLERLDALNLGNLYHSILYTFFQKYFPGDWQDKLDYYLRKLEIAADEVFNSFIGAVILPEGMWQLYQEEVLTTLQELIRSEWENNGYLPAYFEIGFGLGSQLQEEDSYNLSEPVALELEDQSILFRGKIDRIDLSRDRKKAIIWDYKFSGRTGSFSRMTDGYDLQLPLYILIGSKVMSKLIGKDVKIAGAGYYGIKNRRKDGIWREKYEEAVPVTSRSKSCLSEEDWQNILLDFNRHFNGYIAEIKMGNYRVAPEDCSYCDFCDICRYEARRIGDKIV